MPLKYADYSYFWVYAYFRALIVLSTQVLAWIFVGLAIALSAGRYAIRITKAKLQVDDLLHGVALVVVIAYVALVTTSLDLAYEVELFATGLAPTPPPAKDIDTYFSLPLPVCRPPFPPPFPSPTLLTKLTN